MAILDKMNLKIGQRPAWLPGSIHYETLMGSHAYGVARPDSDMDFYGFCVPPAEFIFPQVAGMLPGFDNPQGFDQFQVQHLWLDGKEYDFTIYNIVKYFKLVMDGNPNMVDSIFTPDDCVTTLTPLGKLVRDNRNLFLSQKMWYTFKGMAWSHMARLKKASPKEGRKELMEQFGYDTKDAYHVIRMTLEVKQLLTTGELDLRANIPTLTSIRAGEWPLSQVFKVFDGEMANLENLELMHRFVLPHSPNKDALRTLLLGCLETEYGDLRQFGVK